jgi:hypothetical protein
MGSACATFGTSVRTRVSNTIFSGRFLAELIRMVVLLGSAAAAVSTVPADWGPSLAKYRYVYSGKRVMLVDPSTRTLVQDID